MSPSVLLTVAILAQALLGNLCMSEVMNTTPLQEKFTWVELMSPIKPLTGFMTPAFAMSSMNCEGCVPVENKSERLKNHKMDCPTGMCIAHSLGSQNWTVAATAAHLIPDTELGNMALAHVDHLAAISDPDPPPLRPIQTVVLRC